MKGPKAPETPYHEKVASQMAVRMLQRGKALQGNTIHDYMRDVKRETGHREAGATSADISKVAAEQLKAIQTNPMAVAERSSQHAANLSAGTLTAKTSAMVQDTQTKMGGAKFGLNQQSATLRGQMQLGQLGHQKSMNAFDRKNQKREQMMNLAGVAAGAAIGGYQDHKAKMGEVDNELANMHSTRRELF
jgi:hypothetical protein